MIIRKQRRGIDSENECRGVVPAMLLGVIHCDMLFVALASHLAHADYGLKCVKIDYLAVHNGVDTDIDTCVQNE